MTPQLIDFLIPRFIEYLYAPDPVQNGRAAGAHNVDASAPLAGDVAALPSGAYVLAAVGGLALAARVA
jgi:hypothetical protein